MEASFLKFEDKGLFVGPFLFLLILVLPLPLAQSAQVFLAIFSWVITYWLLTSVPLFATGLMGVALSVVMGISTAKEALAPLADPLILLFMGGFFLAKAFEVVELDRKISLSILLHPLVRGDLNRTLFAVLGMTAFISMWVSNTATTAMMLPIVLGIIRSLNISGPRAQNALLLGMAYAATIGGLATPIGSTPNIIVIGMLERLAGVKLNFFTWVALALPLTLVVLCYLYFHVKKAFVHLKDLPLPEYEVKISFTSIDHTIIFIFSTAVILWFTPSLLAIVLGTEHELSKLLESRLNPGVVSIFMASMLFVFPLQTKKKILALKDALTIDWASLLLFGSGLSLGQMLFKVGLAEKAGAVIMSTFEGAPFIVFLGAIICFTIFFTEVVSNTAAANILLPLLIASSLQAGMNPIITSVACAMSCNMAFMLPVGTPPNAIVYGTGLVTLKEMARFGFILNIVSVVVLTTAFYFIQFVF